MATQQNQFDEEGLSTFEPVRVYDMPGVALNQLLSGNASVSSLVRTVADSPSLSPRERRSISDRIKDSIGRNAITDTVVDLVTNPFVIALALTSPITARQIARSGGRLITGMPNAGVSRKIIDVAKSANLLGLSNAVENRAIIPLMQHVNKNYQTLLSEEVNMVHAPGSKIMEALEKKYKRKIQSLDHTAYEPGALKDELQELGAVVRAHLEGRDISDFTRKTGVMRSPMKVTMVDGTTKWDVGRTGTLRIHLDEQLPVRGDPTAVRIEKGQRINLPDPTTDLKNLHDAWLEARRQGNKSFTVTDPISGKRRVFVTPDEMNVQEAVEVAGHGRRYISHNISSADGAIQMPGPDAVPAGVGFRQIIEKSETQRQWHDSGTYEAWLRDKYDGSALEYANGLRSFFRKRSVQMYGVDSAANHELAMRGGRFEVDTNKVIKLFERISKGRDAGEEMMFIDPEIRSLVRSGQMSSAEFHSYLGKVVNLNLTNRYVPRNDFIEIAANGARLDPHSDEAMASRAGRVSDPRNRTTGSLQLKKAPNANYFDPQDLEALQRAVGRSDGLESEMDISRRYQQEASKQGPTFLTMNIAKQASRYGRDTAGNHSLYLAPIPEPLREIFDSEVRRLNQARTGKSTGKADIKGQYREDPFGRRTGYTEPTKGGAPVGGFNARDLIDAALSREGPEVSDFMEQYLIPRMTGTQGHSLRNMLSFRSMQAAKSSAQAIINSPMLNWATDVNTMSGRVRESLRRFAETPMSMTEARAVTGGIAGWLYKSHLGLNMMSIVGQLLQTPSFVIPTLGFDAWAHGVKQAWKQMDGYAKERVGMPMSISTEERMNLRRKHFPLTNVDGRDLLGVTDDILDAIDGSVMRSRMNAKRRPSTLEWALLEAPLKIFENAEVFNRIATGEATQWKLRQANLRPPIVGGKFAGRPDLSGVGPGVVGYRKNVVGAWLSEADQIEQFVGLVNYGATPMNTPFAMASSTNPAFGVFNLSIPMIRQFFTFPLRSFLFPATTSPILGGGTREFGLQRFGGPSMQMNAMVGDTLRILGVGAAIYTVGKNLTGSDLSQQLGGQAMTDLPSRVLQGKVQDLLPPALDIPVDAITGILRFDDEKLGDALMRVVPAGIALQRLTKALPELPDIPGIEIQKEYADWTNMQGGSVPIYKSNGSLVEMRSAMGTLLKGVGMDMGRFKDEQEAVAFLIRNRDRMAKMKSDYKNALLNNSVGKARLIDAEYKKAFGMPIKVQNNEWKTAIQSREETLMSRQLQRLPAAMEPQFRQVLEGYSSQMSPLDSGLEPPEEM